MLAKFVFVVFATLAAALPAADPVIERSAAATATPNPSQVYLSGYAYGGTGCPQGSVGAFVSTDRTTSVFSPLYESQLTAQQLHPDLRFICCVHRPRRLHSQHEKELPAQPQPPISRRFPVQRSQHRFPWLRRYRQGRDCHTVCSLLFLRRQALLSSSPTFPTNLPAQKPPKPQLQHLSKARCPKTTKSKTT
jgi:hypothetical protein